MRIFWLITTVAGSGFIGYALFQIYRITQFKGVGRVWEILLQKDTVFIDLLQYLPLFIGILAGIVQFVPEMQMNRLKLTLHLPYSHLRMILMMQCIGFMMLMSLFILHYLLLGGYLYTILASELVSRILLTTLPWYMAGLVAYLLTAWLCLEPTWKGRVINAIITAATLRLFFLSDIPEAYNPMILILLILTVCVVGFPWLSVLRFTAGKQD